MFEYVFGALWIVWIAYMLWMILFIYLAIRKTRRAISLYDESIANFEEAKMLSSQTSSPREIIRITEDALDKSSALTRVAEMYMSQADRYRDIAMMPWRIRRNTK